MEAIEAMVDRETEAWNRKDAGTLLSLFHPDMVWIWPPTDRSHDPMTWVMPLGRFNAERWRSGWQSLFESHDLISNERLTHRIEATPEGDGGFAVVDIDTRWRNTTTGVEDRWHGRVCKIYARCNGTWRMTMQTGALIYD